jgi:hypothetical protein
MNKPFKVLCIDGGGIKGLYSAELLAKFEQVFDCCISDCFDMLCGTSTGGIIALAASLKIPMSDVVKFYQVHGPVIFSENTKHKLGGRAYLRIKQTAFGGKYSADPLRSALEGVFKDKTIADSNNFLCIPAYNTLTANPRVFKKDYDNFTEDDRKSYVDVALATSAAPTYLPVMEIEGDQFVDGGLWANNPILVALTEYLYKFSQDSRFDGLEILSISSCQKSKGERHHKLNRAFCDWTNTLFDAYSIGQSKSTMVFLSKLKGCLTFPFEFHRIENTPLSPEQDEIIDMDNASEESMKLLVKIADNTAMNEKMRPEIEHYFITTKTLNPQNY